MDALLRTQNTSIILNLVGSFSGPYRSIPGT